MMGFAVFQFVTRQSQPTNPLSSPFMLSLPNQSHGWGKRGGDCDGDQVAME